MPHLKYRHIIWDWNGTLLDDMPLALDVVNDMLTRRNMQTITQEQYVTLFDHPVAEFYMAIGFDLGRVPFDEITREFGNGYAAGSANCRLQLGAVDALNILKIGGVSQSILSASHRKPLEENVKLHGVRDYFVELVGLDDYYATSKVEEGRQFLRRLPYDPSEVVLIGDTTHDFTVAEELGCECFLVARGHQSLSRLAATGATVLESLEHLLGRLS